MPFAISEMLALMNMTLIMMGLMGGYTLFRRWLAGREREMYEQRVQQERLYELEQSKLRMQATSNDAQREEPSAGPGSGGYIVLHLPDDQKAVFHDVLKGFEEFAQIKGYKISFSIDGSIPDKIAFKFTIANVGISVSTQQVETDLHEYIKRVQQGDSLEDLPIVVPEVQHQALLLVMRNRINFLHHTYVAQKNVLALYEATFNQMRSGHMGVVPTNFYIQGGGTMTPSNYTAIGSQNVAQGQGNEASNNTINQSFHIGQSFNERKDQIDSIERLLTSVRSGDIPSSEGVTRAISNLEKVKDELAHEEKPDAPRVKKWLEIAQAALKTLSLGKDAYDLASKTFGSFGVLF